MAKLRWPILLFFVAILASASSTAAVILQYHHVSKETPPSTSISPELFRQHLDYLSEEGYQVWSLDKLVTAMRSKQEINDKVVVITFDDAFQSIYETAFPLLRARKWPFTVFVSSQPVDAKISPYMSWQQLRELKAGGATIANHGHGHIHFVRRLGNETKAQWLSRVKEDIKLAEQRLSAELGGAPKLLAYPYGEFTEDLMTMIASMGYVAFGQQSGAVGNDMALSALPRFPMTDRFGEMSQFKTKVSSLPLVIESIDPAERIIEDGQFEQGLRIRFKDLEGLISCYLSGFGKVSLQQKGNEIFISKLSELPVGRSRLNCTAPSSLPGRFHWSSYYWMKPLPNGEWYQE